MLEEGFLIGISVTYTDGSRRSLEIALRGDDPEQVRRAAITLAKRAARRSVEDITATILGPASPGSFVTALSHSRYGGAFDYDSLGL